MTVASDEELWLYKNIFKELHSVKIQADLDIFCCLQFSVQIKFVNCLKCNAFVFSFPFNHQ